jgi:hypothetical protein
MLTHNGKILLIAAFFIVILSSLVVAADSWKDTWIEGDLYCNIEFSGCSCRFLERYMD